MPDPDRASQSDIGPNRVRYNDWRQLNVPTLDAFVPTLQVSVVVPCFDASEKLARTLAALERQTYPRRLFEVVVVDDGSDPPLASLSSTLDVRVVRRKRGSDFGAAAARNAGAEVAAHPILVFLDCDVLPEAEFLAAHARWHHVVSDALSIGRCIYVDVDDLDLEAIRNRPGSLEEIFSGRKLDMPWSDGHIRDTNGLTSTDDAPFQVVVSGNLGISKAFYKSIGGFDESFIRYGFEDTEFGYRAYACGALLVPDEKTSAWYQGRWWGNRTANKELSTELYREKIAHLVPHRCLRDSAPGRSFTVPRHVFTIHCGGQKGHLIAKDVDTLLADPTGDLVVRVELAADSLPHRALWLRERYGPDPRVSIVAENTELDDYPFAAFHVSVPVGACARGEVKWLLAALGTGVAARMTLPGAGVAMITRTWALHRSHRTGLPVDHFGDLATISPADAYRLMLRKAVRSLRFLKWLMPRSPNLPRSGPWVPAGPARRNPRPPPRGDVPRAQGADTGHAVAESSSGERSAAPGPPELSFDIAVHNPVAWQRNCDDHVGVLGPPELLPVGSRNHRMVDGADLRSIRLCHHLVDLGTFHRNPRRRAQMLVRLMAAGTPIHVLDHEPELRRLLGPELYALAASGDIRTADTSGREQISVKVRRIALRDHSTYGHPGSAVRPGPSSVSILLVTRRPRFLRWAIANVARQNYPRLELVLALHGAGFEQAAVDRALEPLCIPANVIRVADPEHSLGSVLNAAAAVAGGTFLAKMDDDDLYDEHHVWDLVLARSYSNADIVGKRPEVAYLAQSGKTIRRRFDEGERFAREFAGNSQLLSKQVLDEVNGWPRVASSEDYGLVTAILGIGGSAYRTHGSGMVIVRHGDHTWRKSEDAFLAAAEEVHDGWRPSIAGFSSPAPPLPPRAPRPD